MFSLTIFSKNLGKIQVQPLLKAKKMNYHEQTTELSLTLEQVGENLFDLLSITHSALIECEIGNIRLLRVLLIQMCAFYSSLLECLPELRQINSEAENV